MKSLIGCVAHNQNKLDLVGAEGFETKVWENRADFDIMFKTREEATQFAQDILKKVKEFDSEGNEEIRINVRGALDLQA